MGFCVCMYACVNLEKLSAGIKKTVRFLFPVLPKARNLILKPQTKRSFTCASDNHGDVYVSRWSKVLKVMGAPGIFPHKKLHFKLRINIYEVDLGLFPKQIRCLTGSELLIISSNRYTKDKGLMGEILLKTLSGFYLFLKIFDYNQSICSVTVP